MSILKKKAAWNLKPRASQRIAPHSFLLSLICLPQPLVCFLIYLVFQLALTYLCCSSAQSSWVTGQRWPEERLYRHGIGKVSRISRSLCPSLNQCPILSWSTMVFCYSVALNNHLNHLCPVFAFLFVVYLSAYVNYTSRMYINPYFFAVGFTGTSSALRTSPGIWQVGKKKRDCYWMNKWN